MCFDRNINGNKDENIFRFLNLEQYFLLDYEDCKEDPDPIQLVDALLEVLPHKKRLKKARAKFPNRKNRVKLSHEKYLSETLINHDGENSLDEKDAKPIQESACWSCQFCNNLQDAKFSEYFG